MISYFSLPKDSAILHAKCHGACINVICQGRIKDRYESEEELCKALRFYAMRRMYLKLKKFKGLTLSFSDFSKMIGDDGLDIILR